MWDSGLVCFCFCLCFSSIIIWVYYLFCWAQSFSICFPSSVLSSSLNLCPWAALLSQSKSLILHTPVSPPVWHSHRPGRVSWGGEGGGGVSGWADKSRSAQGRREEEQRRGEAGKGWSALTPEQVLQLPARVFCRGRLLHITPAERKNESHWERVNHLLLLGLFTGSRLCSEVLVREM